MGPESKLTTSVGRLSQKIHGELSHVNSTPLRLPGLSGVHLCKNEVFQCVQAEQKMEREKEKERDRHVDGEMSCVFLPLAKFKKMLMINKEHMNESILFLAAHHS